MAKNGWSEWTCMAEERDSQASEQDRTNKSKEERTRANKSKEGRTRANKSEYSTVLPLLPLTTAATTLSVYSSSSSQQVVKILRRGPFPIQRRAGDGPDLGQIWGRVRGVRGR